jgi:hypothetical protein
VFITGKVIAHGGTASLKGKVVLHAPAGTVSVRLTATLGKLQITGSDIIVRGNKTRVLILSGPIAKVTTALKTLSLSVGKGHGHAKVTVVVTEGGKASLPATINIAY